MNKKEKMEKKKVIGKFLDVQSSRFKDDEVDLLYNFVNGYENDYKGKEKKYKNTFSDWSSDGKYTRTEEDTYSFNDKVGIHAKHAYHDDDGQHGEYEEDITNAREVVNWLKNHKL